MAENKDENVDPTRTEGNVRQQAPADASGGIGSAVDVVTDVASAMGVEWKGETKESQGIINRLKAAMSGKGRLDWRIIPALIVTGGEVLGGITGLGPWLKETIYDPVMSGLSKGTSTVLNKGVDMAISDSASSESESAEEQEAAKEGEEGSPPSTTKPQSRREQLHFTPTEAKGLLYAGSMMLAAERLETFFSLIFEELLTLTGLKKIEEEAIQSGVLQKDFVKDVENKAKEEATKYLGSDQANLLGRIFKRGSQVLIGGAAIRAFLGDKIRAFFPDNETVANVLDSTEGIASVLKGQLMDAQEASRIYKEFMQTPDKLLDAIDKQASTTPKARISELMKVQKMIEKSNVRDPDDKDSSLPDYSKKSYRNPNAGGSKARDENARFNSRVSAWALLKEIDTLVTAIEEANDEEERLTAVTDFVGSKVSKMAYGSSNYPRNVVELSTILRGTQSVLDEPGRKAIETAKANVATYLYEEVANGKLLSAKAENNLLEAGVQMLDNDDFTINFAMTPEEYAAHEEQFNQARRQSSGSQRRSSSDKITSSSALEQRLARIRDTKSLDGLKVYEEQLPTWEERLPEDDLIAIKAAIADTEVALNNSTAVHAE